METTSNIIEPLLERAEEYSKTTVELMKLKFLDRTATTSSTLISRLIFTIVLSFFAFTLTVAISLLIGEILGKNYYGFLVVAAFYGVVALILLSTHSSIKKHINNSIIKHLLN